MTNPRWKHRVRMVYSAAVRLGTAWLPDEVPAFRRWRGFLYGLAMPRCGKHFEVSAGAILWGLEHLQVGDHVYVGPDAKFLCLDAVTVGSHVLFGPNVVVSNGNHVFRDGRYQRGENQTAPIEIGEGSWIGANVTIVAGTKLGRGVLACANACVRGTVADFEMVGGVPARSLGRATELPRLAQAG